MNHGDETAALHMLLDLLGQVVPGLAALYAGPDDTLTGTLGLDSLTIARLGVELNREMGVAWPLENWIAAASPKGTDSLGALAVWLAGDDPQAGWLP
jgi:acyl carrier protein